MNLKPIELQIAIPKSNDVLQMQQHPSQRLPVEHGQMVHQMEKAVEDKLSKPQNVEAAEDNRIRDDGGSRNKQQNPRQRKKPAPPDHGQKQDGKHPYKGKFIDLKL